MPPAGYETLARWREAGEWWQGQRPREIHRYIDDDGKRQEEVRELDPPETLPLPSEAPRVRRIRDEKVARACGGVEEPNYGAAIGRVTGRRDVGVTALHTMSGYAFGRGTMIAAEIPAFAALKGYESVLLADPFSLCGAVEFHETAKKIGIHPLIGATFEMADGGEIVLIAMNATGYRSLSRLITDCHLQEPRLYPLCTWERLEQHKQGVLCLTGGDDGPLNRRLIRRDYEGAQSLLQRLLDLYGRRNVFVQVERSFLPWQISVNRRLLDLADEMRVTAVAGGPVLYERSEHFPAHDVLVCIETLCAIDEIDGRKPRRDPAQPQLRLPPRRGLNAERYFRSASEFADLYVDRPDLIENARRLAERCEEDVLPGRTILPVFGDDEGELLRRMVINGAHARYSKLESRLSRRIGKELERIVRLGFARHFLVAADMCQWAEGEGILFSGRGSVVDSVVAYCLGMSRVDAWTYKLHFDRFLPNNAQKRPDIDIDFEARRREDVRQYLVKKYGDAHVATVAAVGTYRTRGIVREVGKVMGIPEESLSYLSKRLHGSVHGHRLEEAIAARPELRDSGIPIERFHWVFKLSEQMMDLPRNLRAHSSGIVISATPIADTVPVTYSGADGVKIIQWDKRSAKRCFDKFDVLCLRGNDVLGDTERNVSTRVEGFKVTNLPLDDENTYRAMRAGELIGVPQSASPAMRQAHTRIQTMDLKDAGIVQAAIRPGVGGAVKLNEFVARRKGKPYRLLHEDMVEILDHTLGIVVFQEQIDQLLQKFGDYTSDEAEIIRESIYKYRRKGFAENLREGVIGRIIEHGYPHHVASEVYELVAGFQGYGFAEGHALAFAEISVRSIWCQQNYPAEYFAALLDAQPAGYYGPATLVNEARSRGVKILPPDVNESRLTFRVENVKASDDPQIVMPNGGIRVSLRQIGGIEEETRKRIDAARETEPFRSLFDFVARVEPDRDELERLILCGIFDSLHPNRRALLWAIPRAIEYGALVRSMRASLPLFLEDPEIPEGIDDFTDAEKAIYERCILDLDVERHLMAFERERVLAKGGITAAEASKHHPASKLFVVGNPIRLRFPPTQSGKRVMFFDLEDETGLLNVTCFDDVYQRDGHKVICNQYITLWGETQDRDGHIAFLAHRIFPYKPILRREAYTDSPLPIVTADFLMT